MITTLRNTVVLFASKDITCMGSRPSYKESVIPKNVLIFVVLTRFCRLSTRTTFRFHSILNVSASTMLKISIHSLTKALSCATLTPSTDHPDHCNKNKTWFTANVWLGFVLSEGMGKRWCLFFADCNLYEVLITRVIRNEECLLASFFEERARHWPHLTTVGGRCRVIPTLLHGWERCVELKLRFQ